MLAASVLGFASLTQIAKADCLEWFRGVVPSPSTEQQQPAQLEWQGDTLVSVTIDGQKFRMSKSADGKRAIVVAAETVGPSTKQNRLPSDKKAPPESSLCAPGGGGLPDLPSALMAPVLLPPVMVSGERASSIDWWAETSAPIVSQLAGGDGGGSGPALPPAPTPDPDKPKRCKEWKDSCYKDLDVIYTAGVEGCRTGVAKSLPWWGSWLSGIATGACVWGQQKIRDNMKIECNLKWNECLQGN